MVGINVQNVFVARNGPVTAKLFRHRIMDRILFPKALEISPVLTLGEQFRLRNINRLNRHGFRVDSAQVDRCDHFSLAHWILQMTYGFVPVLMHYTNNDACVNFKAQAALSTSLCLIP